MANTREIRRRIRSVESTAKITNALQLVAASKMRRAQERALAARPYAERMRHVLADLANAGGSDEPVPLPVRASTANTGSPSTDAAPVADTSARQAGAANRA